MFLSHFLSRLILPIFWIISCLGIVACGSSKDDEPPKETPIAQTAVNEGLVGIILGKVTAEEIKVDSAGVLEKNKSAQLTEKQYVAIGSNGKSITAMLAARMIESGLLHWDTKILEVLPELKGKILPAYANVTLEQLLDHRSGLLALTSEEEASNFLATTHLPEDPWQRRLAAITWMLNQSPHNIPGSDFHYSNAGYTVAGAMLEKLGNDNYTNLVNNWVLTPLNIIAINTMPATHLDNQPLGHVGNKGQLQTINPQDEQRLLIDNLISPAGSLCLTGTDYAKYLQWHLLALSGKNTPIPASYIEKLQHLGDNDYALGWQSTKLDNGIILNHLGETDGFKTLVFMDQRGSSAVFGITNTAEIDESNPWVTSLLQDAVLKL